MKNKISKRKLICLALGASSVLGLASCGNNGASSSQFDPEKCSELVFHQKDAMTDEEDGIVNSILDMLITGGKSAISGGISSLAKIALNECLKEMGFDTRSVEEKKLDELSNKMDELKEMVAAGYNNITRKIVEIHNKTILDNLLSQIQDVRSTIIAEMAGLVKISEKELDDTYDKAALATEKETFYKGLNKIKFSKVGGNELWGAAENLALNILTPSEADTSVKLFDLYDETFGVLETWDYMTVKPRRQFIAYLATLVNGLAELAKIQASYKTNGLSEDDANYIVVKTGVDRMAIAVNSLNEEFQKQLIALSEIEKDHDEGRHQVHRTRTSDSSGNLIITKDDAISSRLFPVCPGQSEYNYVTFTHTENNYYNDLKYGQWDYGEFIYSLDASEYDYIATTIVSEYEIYAKSLGYADYNTYTVKDYLVDIGFKCYESDKFGKTKGFYSNADFSTWTESGGYVNTHRGMKVNYTSFVDHSKKTDLIDQVQQYAKWIWSSSEYNYYEGEGLNSWYLCFVRADSEAFLGNVKRITTGYISTKDGHSTTWSKLYKGYYTWSQDRGTTLGFLDKHKV